MAFSNILRRVASSVSSLTIPAVGSRAQNIKALNVHRYFCSASIFEEENLIRIIDSKIKQENTTHIVKEIPGLPYVIHYYPKANYQLSLKREYKNEKVNINVPKYALELGGDLIPLGVVILKDSNSSALVFEINAFPHEIQLVNFSIYSKCTDDHYKVKQPNFSNVDEILKKSLLKYLEVREINHITINALRKHMSQKMDSLLWLKDLKGFLEK